MENNNQNQKFPGFPSPYQSWNFPNIVNGYVNILTGAEFKVLWYILRHTYGWQKEEDSISLSQLETGIRKRNGRLLDKGTGLSRSTIIRATKGLEEKGFITAKRTRGGRDLSYVNRYKPKLQTILKEDPLRYQKDTVKSIKKEPTIVIDTIPNTQQSEWIKNYGKGITELIRKYDVKQLEDAIRITESKMGRGEKIDSPIAYITILCKNGAKWEDTEEARGEKWLKELGEKTRELLK